MWKRKLGLGLGCISGIDKCDRIKLFASCGYEAFFTDWSEDAPIEKWASAAAEYGMEYQSIHAPFGKMRDFWHGDEDSAAAALSELHRCLESCARCGIPIMVAHAFIGFHDHAPNDAGVERFASLIKKAEEYGVKIALENTEGEEYLACLFENFGSVDALGFCWDSGHEQCYNRSRDMLALYGSKLIATHLNDNLGISSYVGDTVWTDDLHLLPFDGIIDWQDAASRLVSSGYNGILTFELTVNSKPGRLENNIYAKLSPEEFIAESYKRACRVAALAERAAKG